MTATCEVVMDKDDFSFLGDGIYASFDGYQIELRLPCRGGDHVVYLELSTYEALTKFALHVAKFGVM